MSMPAINAPIPKDNPAIFVAKEKRRVIIKTFKMNNSRDLWFATKANQEFIKGLPNLKRIESKKMAFKSAIKKIVPISPDEAPSAGINIKIGITAIS